VFVPVAGTLALQLHHVSRLFAKNIYKISK